MVAKKATFESTTHRVMSLHLKGREHNHVPSTAMAQRQFIWPTTRVDVAGVAQRSKANGNGGSASLERGGRDCQHGGRGKKYLQP